jgi:CubicO group peptidase (beta-lactamase class C family)
MHSFFARVRPAIVIVAVHVGAACSQAEPPTPGRMAPAARSPGAPVVQQDPRLAARIDSAVRATMEARKIPGASIAVLRRDTLMHIAGYGVTSLRQAGSVAPKTIFQIASLTKPFTAIAVLLLVDDGKLGLDDRASRYVPQLPAKYSTITIRQLLTHTSGIHPDVRLANVDEMDLAEFWKRLEERPPSSAPGSAIQYANTGYAVLSFVVESVSGMEFGTFLRQRIFDPLDMRSTAYRVPQRADSLHALGYDLVEGRNVEAPHVFSGWGNSGIETTAEDLARFAAALERRELLSGAAYQQMFAPGMLASGAPAGFRFGDAQAHYGMGWFLTTYKGRTLHTHGGAIAGFSSILNRFPDEGYFIIVLSNGKQGADRLGQADGVARAIAAVLGL